MTIVKYVYRVSQYGSVDGRQVGVLGSQNVERALSCLENCPLLENMAEWSHWELVFEPEMGSLKDFVQKHGGVKKLTVQAESKKCYYYF